jgi:hypothetical protein
MHQPDFGHFVSPTGLKAEGARFASDRAKTGNLAPVIDAFGRQDRDLRIRHDKIDQVVHLPASIEKRLEAEVASDARHAHDVASSVDIG